MTIVAQQLNVSASIYPSGEAIRYTNPYDRELIVLCEAELGSQDAPIAGNGTYTLRVAIDDVEIVPDSTVTARADQTQITVQSRHLIVPASGVISIRVLGRTGDTAVYCRVTIYDVTPARNEDLFGTGTVIIDHNYGGLDALRIVAPTGAAIEGVELRAYTAADYNAGRRSRETIRGITKTDVEGRWRNVLMLSVGSYKLVCAKPSQIETRVVDLEVTA